MSEQWIANFARKNGGYKLLSEVSGYERAELSDFSRGLAQMTGQQIDDIVEAMKVIRPDFCRHTAQSDDELLEDDSALFFSGCGGLPLLVQRVGVTL